MRAVEKESPSKGTIINEKVSTSFNDPSDNLLNIMVDDNSIVAFQPSHDRGLCSDPDATNSEVLEAKSKISQSCKSLTKIKEYTSPLACVDACDVMVRTEPSACLSAFTQTEDPGTADAHLNTEVNMADLDFLTEVRQMPESNYDGNNSKTKPVKLYRNLRNSGVLNRNGESKKRP